LLHVGILRCSCDARYGHGRSKNNGWFHVHARCYFGNSHHSK
jgi:hypothetical protein